MGRNVAIVEAEIKELERELALPGKPVQDVDDFEEVNSRSIGYLVNTLFGQSTIRPNCNSVNLNLADLLFGQSAIRSMVMAPTDLER